MTHSVAIESYLPEVGSPLFHDAVEEVVSIWEANPSVSYETVLFRFLVGHLLSASVSEDAWFDETADDLPFSESVTDIKESFFVANTTSEEVTRFLQGVWPKERVASCLLGNRCSDQTCQLFHGPLCEFHAGMKVHFGGPKRGQKMTCGKGLACPFDHASAEMRAARVNAGIQQKRIRFAPKLATEADILSVFPSIEWRFSDVYTYGLLSEADMDLLEVCLERSPQLGIVPLLGGLQIATSDFMDSRDMPDPPPFVAAPSNDGWEIARRR